MANHAYAKTGNKLDVKELDAHIRKIVAEKLNGVFEVNYDAKEKTWLIHYPKDDYMGFLVWISDEEEFGEMKRGEFVEYDKPKLIRKNSVIEFRHGHTYQFMWWVEGVIRENLGEIYGARMFDDGCDINPKPNPAKFETFEKFCDKIKGEGTIKGTKDWYLPDYQRKAIPKEVTEKLNLDF